MDVYVARQPIFDLTGNVAGYELLYRRGAESRFADGEDTTQMSRDVVIQSFLEVGLEKITRGKAGFINFEREMLVEGWYDLLDPASVVIELLEDVPVDEEVERACRRLVAGGYKLALDDFVIGGPHEALVDLASIVKVDVLARDLDELSAATASLRARGVRLLAEKVETTAVHEECRKLGFQFFQGYFFSRPEIVAEKGVTVEQTAMIQLMNLLGDDRATDQDVEEAFRRDLALSYKLLRMLSTAAMGGRGVESILYAIRLLGRGTLQRWLSLLLASSFTARGGTDVELVQAAVLRARFCELLGVRARKSSSADALFLVGLFSLMDALLRAPMEEVLQRVDLADQVRSALLRREGAYADVLTVVEAYECGSWEVVADLAPRVGVASVEVSDVYLDAVNWAREQLLRAA